MSNLSACNKQDHLPEFIQDEVIHHIWNSPHDIWSVCWRCELCVSSLFLYLLHTFVNTFVPRTQGAPYF